MAFRKQTAEASSVTKLHPLHFIHVLDNNSGVTRVEVGPQTFTRQEHEKVVLGPEKMVMIPPRHYCTISNPVMRDDKGEVILDKHNNVKLRHGDEEIRFEQEPFALFPGEKLIDTVEPLQVISTDAAIRLRAVRDFEDSEKVKRVAGDEWLFRGPGTYYPRVEVQVVKMLSATIVKANEALRMRAVKECVDAHGTKRQAGEEWLQRSIGAYIPHVDEEVVRRERATILTEKKALHLKAVRTFTDNFGKERKAGEEWLVSLKDAEAHICDVYEELVGEVNLTTLTNQQYCVVIDPVKADGKQLFGQRELRKGPVSFFLQPGEKLEMGIQNVNVLGEEEALLLRAKEEYDSHKPGDRWMIYGPRDYVPPVEVDIVEKRISIPLDENEGIYVRDVKSGKVTCIVGQSYMLKPNEELWEKDLPSTVEQLLEKINGNVKRDRTRVVTLRVPHNTAVQIYDYKDKKSRVVFGPNLVLLGPDEHPTMLSLSGDKPKKPHQIKALVLMLGPDFMTDVVTVETSDHARLSLKLSYNWHFDIKDRDDVNEAAKIFSVPDFVGDACKAIASRVRGAVAATSFDAFHKSSARVIRSAVFGLSADGKVQDRFYFAANSLVITNIDIQSVEPVDQRTRDSLQKSVQLAIEITTKSQEASARHEAERKEQEARGKLERQKISDEAEAEKARKDLLQLQANSAAVESTGHAIAESRAQAEASHIASMASVEQAKLKAQAQTIKSSSELKQQTLHQAAELAHQRALDELELSRASQLAEIEAKKFKDTVDAIGPQTIKSIAQAGPELQAKLLQGLGLKSTLIVDGSSPVNLFSTANGLLGVGQQ